MQSARHSSLTLAQNGKVEEYKTIAIIDTTYCKFPVIGPGVTLSGGAK